MVRSPLMALRRMSVTRARPVTILRELDAHAKELLAHEKHVPGAQLGLCDTQERTVRASEIREKEFSTIPRQATVKPRDVPVFREHDIASLAAKVDAALWNRKRVARFFAPDHECNAAHVTFA